MRLRGEEDGFTLVELLVVLALLPVVLIALFGALDTSAKLAPRTIDYADAVGQSGNGLSRAIREIRQAYRVLGTTPNSITFLRVINGVDTQVSISCGVSSTTLDDQGVALRRCVRTSARVGTALPSPAVGSILVDRLINGTATDPVFAYTPDPISPTFVAMVVRVPSRGEARTGAFYPITIDDGTLLRNNALGS
jgi:prepilin-type N-terminal cleavage/methylation domain-containing protein